MTLDAIADRFWKSYSEYTPTIATVRGEHRFDDRLRRFDEEWLDEMEIELARGTGRVVRPGVLDVDGDADADALLDPALGGVELVQVVDDGVGLGVRPRDRYGLDIMAERARRVGAALVIENRPEGGTVVDVSLGNQTAKAEMGRGSRASDSPAG